MKRSLLVVVVALLVAAALGAGACRFTSLNCHLRSGADFDEESLDDVSGKDAGAARTELPKGFRQEVVAAGLQLPTAFALLPGGDVLIGEKAGTVRIVRDGRLLPQAFLDISSRVNTHELRGLLAIRADPDFAKNGFFYVLYAAENDRGAADQPKTMRLSRFTARGNAASPASEKVVLGKEGTSPCNDLPSGADCLPADGNHLGGDIRFAADGSMFVAVGDGAREDLDETNMANAARAQNVDLLAGKLLRVTREGRGLAHNPLWNGNPSANRSKVWAYGLRNPFRFTLRPGDEVPVVADLGWRTWEEIDVIRRGGNYGWPCYEGKMRPRGHKDRPLCQRLYAQGPSAVERPFFAYTAEGDQAVSGGAFYDGTSFPRRYAGAYFFGDYSGNWIRYLPGRRGGGLEPGPARTFADRAAGPVAVDMGPEGALYYLTITGELRRVGYTG
jgi:glucose/arabinose dehydrogenase